MVVQDMAQSYSQLFHTSQEPQEFMSLEELNPELIHNETQTRPPQHEWVSTSNTTAHLYRTSTMRNRRNPQDGENDDDLGNDNDSTSHSAKEQQQRTYYNLSSAVKR